MRKNNFSGVANFDVELSCARDALKYIYKDITTCVQYSDHDYNSSNNDNKASNADSGSNSDDELL